MGTMRPTSSDAAALSSAPSSAGVAQHLKLRLDDLQLSAARVLLDLAVERDQLAGLELILQVGAVEPEAFQAAIVPGPR